MFFSMHEELMSILSEFAQRKTKIFGIQKFGYYGKNQASDNKYNEINQ